MKKLPHRRAAVFSMLRYSQRLCVDYIFGLAVQESLDIVHGHLQQPFPALHAAAGDVGGDDAVGASSSTLPSTMGSLEMTSRQA